jgi:hypothetical protein
VSEPFALVKWHVGGCQLIAFHFSQTNKQTNKKYPQINKQHQQTKSPGRHVAEPHWLKREFALIQQDVPHQFFTQGNMGVSVAAFL